MQEQSFLQEEDWKFQEQQDSRGKKQFFLQKVFFQLNDFLDLKQKESIIQESKVQRT